MVMNRVGFHFKIMVMGIDWNVAIPPQRKASN